MKKSDMANFNIFNDPECERTGLTSAFKKALHDIAYTIPPSKYDPENSGFPDGSIRWISSKIYPIKNRNGKIKNIVLIMEDITALKDAEAALQKAHDELESKVKERTKELYNQLQERKLLEEELRFSAEKFERWKASSPIGIIQSNAEGGINDVNDTILEMLGYTRQDLLNGNLDWTKLTPPEFLHLDMKAMEEAAVKGFWTPFEKEYFHKDGHRVSIIIGGSVFKEYADEYIVFVIDVTERKKNEEKLRQSEKDLKASQRIAHLGSWRLDLKTNRVVWTEELYKMYGFDPTLPPPPYTEHMKLFTPESWERLSTALARTSEKGIPHELELETVREDRSNGWMWVRGEAINDSAGNTIGLWGAAQDITDRKNAQIQIFEKEKALRLSLDAARAGTWSWDIVNGDVIWDDQMQRIFGIKPGTFDGTFDAWKKKVHPEDIQDAEKATLSALEHDGGYEYEYRIKGMIPGDWRIIDARAITIRDNDGNPLLMSGFAMDITERKMTEMELWKSKERFRSVAETAVDAIISIDGHGRIIFWNKAAQVHFGYSDDEVNGKSIGLIIPERFHKRHQEGMKNILGGGRSKIIGKTIEIVGLKKNGTEFPIELSLAMWKIKEDLFFTAIIRDISERKIANAKLRENEEKFRSVFENSPLAIVHFDKSGVITACNETLCKILGSTTDKLIGLDTAKSLKDAKMLNSITTALSGQKSQYIGEYLSVTGAVRTPIRAIYAPIFSDDGEVTGAIGIAEDIKDQLVAEQNKTELESQLRQLQKNEAIGALAGGIAHDFNNILFPIVGFAEMLEEDLPENSDLHENVDMILSGAKRAKELVKQILTFSRQVEQDVKPLKPHLIIKEVAKLVRSTIPTSIEVKKIIDPKTRMIMADPTQIHQVAMNLVTNASQAMQESGGILTIRLQNIERTDISKSTLKLGEDSHVLLSIGDTGTGMDKNTIEKIFDPYFTTKPKEKGTGLGLSVVHGIVTNCGGDISVKSSLGKGTIFDVYIPAFTKEISEKNHESEEIIGGNERILLVDDEKKVLRIEQVILERLGYRIELQSSSLKALEAVKANPDSYDLVISDMTMPNMTGDQMTRKILEIRPTLPIIICTGFSERISLENVKSMGAKALLMKPIIKSKLATTISKVLDDARKEAENNC